MSGKSSLAALLVLLLTFPQFALASDVLIDSVPTAVLDTSAPYTLPSIVIGSNPNRFLFGGITQREQNINNVLTNVFNGSESLTKLTSLDGNSTSSLNVSVWYRLAPSVTTASGVATATNAADMVLGAISVYNVNQSSPFRDQSGANFKQTAVSAVAAASLTMDTVAGDLVVSLLMAGDSVSNVTDLVPTGGATQRWDVANGGLNFARGGCSTLLATGASTVMSWTWTNNEQAVLIAFVLKPATNIPVLTRNLRKVE